jgi:hypothetical protein
LLAGVGSDTVDSQEGRYPLSANLDLVRSIYAAWEQGDFRSVEWAHPEIEFVLVGGIDGGTWTGLPAMAKTLRERLSALEAASTKAEHYRELDGGRVLVLCRVSGRFKTSGVELADVPLQSAYLFHVHGGKVSRLVLYWERERALADLGLAGERDSP